MMLLQVQSERVAGITMMSAVYQGSNNKNMVYHMQTLSFT